MSQAHDIFISFKALGADGKPTRDSALAHEIYEYLVARNLNVFYSRISLEKLGVSAFKKAIDDALDSAHVLVAVGTSAANLDSEWVRYEWDSFYNDILSGVKPQGKVFVYVENVALASLPRALRQSQAINHGEGSFESLYNFVANALGCQSSESIQSQRCKATSSGMEEGRTTSEAIEDIEEDLNRHILGQEGAVRKMASWIRRLRFGIRRHGRPAAVFLFLGPTGVGKTEMAQQLARLVFRDPGKQVFLEMAQFASPHDVSGFIGSPPGFVGWGEGLLSKAIRDMPECVVIFDEIEKTDPTKILGVVMRLVDEGVVWDAGGAVRDGRGCVIVMCTNAGQGWLCEQMHRNPNTPRDSAELEKGLLNAAVVELSNRGIRPEFLDRIDEVITFLPISPSTCRKLVDRVLDRELAKFEEKGIGIAVDEAARDILAQHAYSQSEKAGARCVARVINRFVVAPAIDLLTCERHDAMPSAVTVSASADNQIRLRVRSRG